jgi:hypothetical protein
MENDIDKAVNEEELIPKQSEQGPERPIPLIYESSPGYVPYIIL